MLFPLIEDQQLMISIKKTASASLFNKRGLQTAQLPSRHKRQYIQQLETQVNKSRIAIENMSHAKAFDPNFYKKVEELQKELHRSILAINQESNKNKTLQELIVHLKGQMNEFQAVQRNEQEYESNNFEKKIKKVEYDIKQILHKYNEEIAKINNLKEEANAARDDRVVYSNLFNKIQKEIKHQEEIYKQTLIKNQISLVKKKEDQISKPQESLDEKFEETMQNFNQVQSTKAITKVKIGTTLQLSKLRDTKSREAKKSLRNEADMFLTNIKDTRSVINDFRASSETSSTRDKNACLNKNIENMIEEKQGEIQRLIMASQCQDFESVFEFYNQIYEQNDCLFQEVEHLDAQISVVQEDINQITKQKRTSDVYENGQIANIVNVSKNFRSTRSIVTEDQPVEDQVDAIVFQMCKIMEIDTNTEGEVINDDIIRQIDRKVAYYATNLHFQRRGGNRRQSKMLSAQQMSSNTDRAAQIFDKIEKINESDKIFDREMFKLQYQKELAKARKKGKKSN